MSYIHHFLMPKAIFPIFFFRYATGQRRGSKLNFYFSNAQYQFLFFCRFISSKIEIKEVHFFSFRRYAYYLFYFLTIFERFLNDFYYRSWFFFYRLINCLTYHNYYLFTLPTGWPPDPTNENPCRMPSSHFCND